MDGKFDIIVIMCFKVYRMVHDFKGRITKCKHYVSLILYIIWSIFSNEFMSFKIFVKKRQVLILDDYKSRQLENSQKAE